MSLGTYTTIPDAPCSSAIDREDSCFLDVVLVDIAFGDCIAPGGLVMLLFSLIVLPGTIGFLG